jgi:DNA-binding MarR family transcriptional regulator
MSAEARNLHRFSEGMLPGNSGFLVSTSAQAQCICAATRRAARAVNEFYDLVLAPTRIKSTQYILLRSIEEAGVITQSQLGERLGVAIETLSRRLASLRTVGWVELRPSRNRRERLYGITPTGKAQLEKALPYWIRAENRLRDSLTDKEWSTALRSLKLLAQAAKNAESARISNTLPMRQRRNGFPKP